MDKRFFVISIVVVFAAFLLLSMYMLLIRPPRDVINKAHSDQAESNLSEETDAQDAFSRIFDDAFKSTQKSIREDSIPEGLTADEVCILEGEIVSRGTIISGGTCVPIQSPTPER